MKVILLAVASIGVLYALTGCNAGMAPSGGSDAEVKSAFDKLPIEERVKVLMRSPAPMSVKSEKIKAMYAKEGKQVPDGLLQGGASGAPGAPKQ